MIFFEYQPNFHKIPDKKDLVAEVSSDLHGIFRSTDRLSVSLKFG